MNNTLECDKRITSPARTRIPTRAVWVAPGPRMKIIGLFCLGRCILRWGNPRPPDEGLPKGPTQTPSM